VHGLTIEAREIAVFFGRGEDRLQALDDVSVTAQPGEIVALLGPNGAGKSTLLKVLALLAQPRKGEVYYGALSSRGMGERTLLALRRRIGLVPETPFVFNLLTGREYLSFAAEIFGVPRADLGPRVERLMTRFDLSAQGDAFVRTYSQGMLKKLVLAAALVHQPEVLLLDEPTNSLDPVSIVTLRETLSEERNRGATIILSTHLLDMAERLADRIVIMDRGRVVDERRYLGERKTADQSELEKHFHEVTHR